MDDDAQGIDEGEAMKFNDALALLNTVMLAALTLHSFNIV